MVSFDETAEVGGVQKSPTESELTVRHINDESASVFTLTGDESVSPASSTPAERTVRKSNADFLMTFSLRDYSAVAAFRSRTTLNPS